MSADAATGGKTLSPTNKGDLGTVIGSEALVPIRRESLEKMSMAMSAAAAAGDDDDDYLSTRGLWLS